MKMNKLEGKALSALLAALLLASALLGMWSVTAIGDRYIYVRNFENVAYTNYPVQVQLAFPDGNVSNSDMASMVILDSSSRQVPYQVEGNFSYPSGFIESATVWMSVTVAANATNVYTFSFGAAPESYGSFGTVTTTSPFINVTTNSFQKVSLSYDSGIGWVSVKNATGAQMMKSTSSEHILNTNSLWTVLDQTSGASAGFQSDQRIRAVDSFASPSNITVQTGPLFVKIFWTAEDTASRVDSGWIRVWGNQSWIECYTNATAPVNYTYPQTDFYYRFDGQNSNQGTAVNNGTLNYAKADSANIALTGVIYQAPTNFYGYEVNSYCTSTSAVAAASGINQFHFIDSRSNFTTYDNVAINGKVGVPGSFLFLDGAHETIESVIRDYFHRPVASYYSSDEDQYVQQETLSLFRTFLTNYQSEFIDSMKSGQQSTWNSPLATAYASLILFDINRTGNLDAFVSYLQDYEVDGSKWSNPSYVGETLPNLVKAAYYIHEKTGDPRVLQIAQNILDGEYYYATTSASLASFLEPVNKRSAMLQMTSQLRAMFPANPNATALFDQVNTPDFLYNSTEAFSAGGYQKYQLYGQGYNTPSTRDMYTLTTNNYLINAMDMSEYAYLDLTSFVRSYGVEQNSVWTRLGHTRDDYTFELAHLNQDRLLVSASFPAYIRTFLSIPSSQNVSGTTSALLSLNYLRSITNSSGFIPWADPTVLMYENGTFSQANALVGDCINSGWYSNCGVIEAAIMNYELGYGVLSYIAVTSSAASIVSGGAVTFTAVAYDAHANLMGDVSDTTSWQIEAGAGGSWVNNTYTSEHNGTWAVSGTYSGKVGVTSLTVTALPDYYSVTLTLLEAVVLQGDTVHVNVTTTRNSLGFGYLMNITRDGQPFLTDFAGTQFTDTEPNPQGHTYTVQSLTDTDYGTQENFASSPLEVVWQPPGGSGNTGGPGNGDSSPTPQPTPEPSDGMSAEPLPSSNPESGNEQPIDGYVIVLILVIAALVVGVHVTANARSDGWGKIRQPGF